MITVTGVPATILVTSIGAEVTTCVTTTGVPAGAAGAHAPSAKAAAIAAENTAAIFDCFILPLLLGGLLAAPDRRTMCYSSRTRLEPKVQHLTKRKLRQFDLAGACSAYR